MGRWAVCRSSVLIGLVVTAAVSFGACALAPNKTPSGTLTITSHNDGDTVTTPLIAIQGSAPPNAPITRDIAMARDAHTQADATGHWTMPVSLKEGNNSLTFRVGDDKSTAHTIHVTYRKLASTPHPTGEPSASAVKATVTPAATPVETAVATSTQTSTEASSAPTGTPTPKPTATPTPKPTATPTPKPTAAPANNLGTRSDLQLMLSVASGYSWESSPLRDGTPRSQATSDDQHAVCGIIGPDDAVTRVYVVFVVGDATGAFHAGAMLGILLDEAQSGPAVTWAESQIASALTGSNEIDQQKTFGNRRVEVITAMVDDSTMAAAIIVTPA
jgi:hypothetical protein